MQIAGAIAAVNATIKAKGGVTATPEEVHRRANICISCPLRQKIRGQLTSHISKALGAFANRERVPDDIKDYRCGACGCSLMLLLPARGEHLHKDTPAQSEVRSTKASHCWLPVAIRDAKINARKEKD